AGHQWRSPGRGLGAGHRRHASVLPETGPAGAMMAASGSSTDQALPAASRGVAQRSEHEPDEGGHSGVYGGRHVPEALMAVIEEVTAEYDKVRLDPDFLAELDRLQRDYTGRPSPVFECTGLAEHAGG